MPLRETIIWKENVSFSLYLPSAAPFCLLVSFSSYFSHFMHFSFIIVRKFLSLFCLLAFVCFLFLSLFLTHVLSFSVFTPVVF